MALKQDWKTLFESDSFVAHYKTGEKITGKFAKTLIDQSGIVADSKSNPSRPLVVFDNACGTGIVSSILHHELGDDVLNKWGLTCGDISEGMLNYTRRRMEEEKWQNAETKIVDAQKTGLPSAHYTHIFTAFAYMALPDSPAALDESVRALQPDGTIAFSTWIEPGWVPIIRKAIETMPENLPFPTTQEFLSAMGNGEWYSVPWIESELKQRGLEGVNVRIDTKPIALTAKELVETSLIMLPMVLQRWWTVEQREQHEEKVGPAVWKYVEDTYGKDGIVPMDWTAILSTARKSG